MLEHWKIQSLFSDGIPMIVQSSLEVPSGLAYIDEAARAPKHVNHPVCCASNVIFQFNL